MSVTRGVVRRLLSVDPPGFDQSHCNTLLVLPDGEFLVAWFAGAHEGADDVRILLARGLPDGIVEPPAVLWPDAEVCHWNPVLAFGPDARVWLFFKRGPSIQTWVTYVATSDDLGRTWSTPEPLVPDDETGGRGPVRHPPLTYADAWVAPGSVEDWTEPVRWDVFMDVLESGRWTRVPVPLEHAGLRGAGCIQPSLWVTRDGALAALCRSTAGAAYRTATRDPHRWPPLEPVGLPNNNSGLAVLAMPDGRIVCVHNPATDDWGARCPLVLSTSDDDGLSWRLAAVTVEDGSPFDGTPAGPRPGDDARAPVDGRPTTAAATGVVTSGAGEYSYPQVRLSAYGEEVLVTYSWQRRGIALARVPVALLD